MTKERFAELKALCNQYAAMSTDVGWELISEVERLQSEQTNRRAEVQNLRDLIAEAGARLSLHYENPIDADVCDRILEHFPRV